MNQPARSGCIFSHSRLPRLLRLPMFRQSNNSTCALNPMFNQIFRREKNNGNEIFKSNLPTYSEANLQSKNENNYSNPQNLPISDQSLSSSIKNEKNDSTKY